MFNPGVGKVLAEQKRPDLPWTPVAPAPTRDEFSSGVLGQDWNMLRTPQSSWYALDSGSLSLELRPHRLDQLGNPSLLARRIRHHEFSASLKLDFEPSGSNEKAGLVLYRSSACHYQFLQEEGALVITRTEQGKQTEVARVPWDAGSVVLRAEADGLELQFSYGVPDEDMLPLGDVQSMSVMSFELALGFNGPYVGMYATSGERASTNRAVFDWFEYEG